MKRNVDVTFSCSGDPSQGCSKVVGKAGRVSLRIDAINSSLVRGVLDAGGRIIDVYERVSRRAVTLAAQVDGGKRTTVDLRHLPMGREKGENLNSLSLTITWLIFCISRPLTSKRQCTKFLHISPHK